MGMSEVATDAGRAGRDLARLLASGDADAVRQIYRAYGRLAFTIAYRILGDSGQAEDATQTAFTKLWQAAARVQPDSDIRPLLFTIVRRAAFDVSESSRHRRWTPLQDVPDPPVEDGLDQLSTEWQVREAVDSLPEDEREIVKLQHLQGMTHTEIAGQLGVPVGTVKSRSFRAHKRLLSLLGPLREEVA
jgi:RNA polymerase sigma factor (sigma-70 family)